MNVKEKVLSIVNEQFGEPCTPESSLEDDLLFDSLDGIELMMSIEDEFEITISDDDFEKAMTECKTVADLIAAVEKVVKAQK
jgi:acyl carrier protein